MICITCDSSSDLPKSFREKHNIAMIPLFVILDEETFEDGIDINNDKIFDFVSKTKMLPKTAARSVPDYVDFFTPVAEKCDTIIHISIGDGFSSSYRNAFLASEEFENGKIIVLDSKSLCIGIGAIVMSAIDKIEKNMPVDQIVKELENEIDKNQLSFVVDRLDYLHKGGRCSGFSFAVGSMMKIKPKLQLIDGKIINTGKDIGPLKVVAKKYIDSTLQKYPNMNKKRCLVAHTIKNQALLDELCNHIKAKNIFEEIIVVVAGSTITSHCGEGTFGIGYLCE